MAGEPPGDKWTPRGGPAARLPFGEPPREPEPSRVRRLALTWVQLAVALVLIVGLASLVLLTVYRSRCPEHGKLVTRWSFVAPWENPPADCRRNQSGFSVLRDDLGL